MVTYDEGLPSELDIGSVLSKHFPEQCGWGYFSHGLLSDTSRRLADSTTATSNEGMQAYCFMGPDEWYKLPGNEKCESSDSSLQSPIDIVSTEDASSELPTLAASYTSCEECVITNDGHTVEVAYSGTSSLDIGSALDVVWDGSSPSNGTVYSLQQLTFHWSEDDTKGSEHLVGGKAFPLELQLMHTQDGNDDAAHSKGGLAGGVYSIQYICRVCTIPYIP
jgi:carbonic anhydrase